MDWKFWTVIFLLALWCSVLFGGLVFALMHAAGAP